jgi:hypothetical protein
MPETEMWTTSEAAAYLGASSPGSARKILSRLGISAAGRRAGRDGENLYEAAKIRAAREPGLKRAADGRGAAWKQSSSR